MSAALNPAAYCLAVWWVSTGVIVLLNNLPRRTFAYSFSAATLIAAVSLYRLRAGNHDTSMAGTYAAFTYGVLVWGWHEMAFFMGFVTGPRRVGCAPGCATGTRFRQAVGACIYHELAILVTGLAVLWACWGAPNQVGMWTFMVLWGMRLSAKLNVFLGVLNLGESFLPAHLTYLLSFMARRRMNWLMPVSLAGGLLCTAWLTTIALRSGTSPEAFAGLTFVITMLALAVLEHAMLVLPLPFTALWSWWLRARGTHEPEVVAAARPAAARPAAAPATRKPRLELLAYAFPDPAETGQS